MAGDGTDTDAAFEDEVEQTLTIREYMDGIEAEELVITRPTLPISAHVFFNLTSIWRRRSVSSVCVKP
jgi:hypothetical protein